MSLFDIEEAEKKLENLEKQTLKEDFWKDSKNSSKILSQIKYLKNKVLGFREIEKEIKNLQELTELVILEPDEELIKEIIKNTKKLEKDIEKLEISNLLSGKYDLNNAIITIHPGAGGTESQDWAEMLYRMYTRWSNKNNYEVKELDYLEGEEAGLKVLLLKLLARMLMDI